MADGESFSSLGEYTEHFEEKSFFDGDSGEGSSEENIHSLLDASQAELETPWSILSGDTAVN